MKYAAEKIETYWLVLGRIPVRMNSVNATTLSDMEYLKDSYKNGWDMQNDYVTFYKAVKEKRFDVMMWMIEEGYYNWTNESLDDIAAAAAEIGRIDIMQWALDMGWDMDSFTFLAGTIDDRIDVLEFMRKNGYDVKPHRDYMMDDEFSPIVTEWLRNCA
jgi:hypothetical protein